MKKGFWNQIQFLQNQNISLNQAGTISHLMWVRSVEPIFHESILCFDSIAIDLLCPNVCHC